MTSDVVDAPRSASAEHLRTEIAAALTEVMAQWDAWEVDASKRAGFLLGDFTEAMLAVFNGQVAETQWAVRRSGPHGSNDQSMPDEETARYFAAGETNAEYGYSSMLMRRRVGRWIEVTEDA